MELMKLSCKHTFNAYSPTLQISQPNLKFNVKTKANVRLPNWANSHLFSKKWISLLNYSEKRTTHFNEWVNNRGEVISHVKEGGKAMWVVFVGVMLCYGNPVYMDSVALGQSLDLSYSTDMVCREEEEERSRSEAVQVSNEDIVEEAWRVVDENFLDARHHKWSPEFWRKKKDEALRRPIQSISSSHDVIKKMLASLDDPYTKFLTPSEFTKLARYDLTGIGLNLKEVPGEDGVTRLKVLGMILEGPAYSAGIRQGDEILSVNGTSVRGMTSFEAASLIQGPKETFVSLEVKHGNCGEAQNITVERQQVVRTPVFYRLEKAENGNEQTGYIRLKEFNALARRDLMIAMRRLKDAGATNFVLDLRNNPGGLVQAGIEIAKLFLGSGETVFVLLVENYWVIYTTGRNIDLQKSILAQNAPLTTTPLMILVNGHTASASEIVAAALHDNCRAILVGERTYGKGLIQSVFELKDGSGIVVTAGKYVTPSHKDIDGNGIEPDFYRRPGLAEAKQTLERCHASENLMT